MFKRLIALLVCLTFSFTNLQYVRAQDFSIDQLPVPGTMIGKSGPFAPLALKGLVVNPQKPLEFQFIVDTGRGPQDTVSVKDQANQLVKYFLAGLTIPEGDLWVNLSPYEKKRMVPEALGQTDLGRDLLAQDYILKQLTASLIYPEKDLGKEFWSRVYTKAQEQFGTTNVPVNTFNKVWILPDQAQVFENGNAAYVTKSTLKVMLDEDYLALSKQLRNSIPSDLPHQGGGINTLGSQIARQIILPEIEIEVNTGKNFAPLRQIYQALILAKWYKENIQNSLLDAVYTDKNKTAGVNFNDPNIKEQIYNRYLQAYKKGVFNYIKEDQTPDGQDIPRKYFSGGISRIEPEYVAKDGSISDVKSDGAMVALRVVLEKEKNGSNIDRAMLNIVTPHQLSDHQTDELIRKFYRTNILKERMLILRQLESSPNPRAREIFKTYERLDQEVPELKEYRREDVILDYLPKAIEILRSGGNFEINYAPAKRTLVRYITKNMKRWELYGGDRYIDYKMGKITVPGPGDDLNEILAIKEVANNSNFDDYPELIQIVRKEGVQHGELNDGVKEKLEEVENGLKEIRQAISQSQADYSTENLQSVRSKIAGLVGEFRGHRSDWVYLYYLASLMENKMPNVVKNVLSNGYSSSATQVLLIDSERKRVLLQKRGDFKLAFPGKWTVSANTKETSQDKIAQAVQSAVLAEVGINIAPEQVQWVKENGRGNSNYVNYDFYAIGDEETVRLEAAVKQLQESQGAHQNIHIEFYPLKRSAVIYSIDPDVDRKIIQNLAARIQEETKIPFIGPVSNMGQNSLVAVTLNKDQELEVERKSVEKENDKSIALKRFQNENALEDMGPLMSRIDSDKMRFIPWPEVYNMAKHDPDDFALDLTSPYFDHPDVWEEMGMAKPESISLVDPMSESLDVVGGKGRNLAILKRISRFIHDLHVPESEIVTAFAYDRYVLGNKNIRSLIEQLDRPGITDGEIDTISAKIREAIVSIELPEDFKKNIYAIWERLGKDIAVRSSATTEDLKEYSAAGQADSFLHVVSGDDAVKAVLLVWASLFKPGFIKDRSKSTHTLQVDAKMPVVLQSYIDATAAGAAKTIGNFNRPIIRINAQPGPGESVVEGEGAVDSWDVNLLADKILEKKITHKTMKYSKRTTGGIQKESFSSNQPSLTDRQVIRLARIIREIGQYYRDSGWAKYVDVEFAFDMEGSPYIVQTRSEDANSLNEGNDAVNLTINVVDEQQVPHDIERKHLNEIGSTATFGVAVGKLMIIPGIYAMNRVEAGSILVTDHTNNEWNDVFGKLEGVITMDGGDTSHASKNSRRIGIPCYVGSSGALQQLAPFDGKIVTFDSTNRVVYLGAGLPVMAIPVPSEIWAENEAVYVKNLGQRDRHELYKSWEHNRADRTEVFRSFFDGNLRRRSATYSNFQLDYYWKAWDWLTDYLNERFKGRAPWVLGPQKRIIRDHGLNHKIIDDDPMSIYYFLNGLTDVNSDDFNDLFGERVKAFRHFSNFMGGINDINKDNVESLMDELVRVFMWMHIAYWLNAVVNINYLPDQIASINPIYQEFFRLASVTNLPVDQRLDISQNKDAEIEAVLEHIRMDPALHRVFVEEDVSAIERFLRGNDRYKEIIQKIDQWSLRYKKTSEDIRLLSDTKQYLTDLKERLMNPLKVSDELVLSVYGNLMLSHEGPVDLEFIRQKEKDFYYLLRGWARFKVAESRMPREVNLGQKRTALIRVSQDEIDDRIKNDFIDLGVKYKEQQLNGNSIITKLNHYPELKKVLSLSMRETLLREDGHHLIVPQQRKIAEMMLNMAAQFKDIVGEEGNIFELGVDEIMALLEEAPDNRAYISKSFARRRLEDIADKQIREDWNINPHAAADRFDSYIDTSIHILQDQLSVAKVTRVRKYYAQEIDRLTERKVEYQTMAANAYIDSAMQSSLRADVYDLDGRPSRQVFSFNDGLKKLWDLRQKGGFLNVDPSDFKWRKKGIFSLLFNPKGTIEQVLEPNKDRRVVRLRKASDFIFTEAPGQTRLMDVELNQMPVTIIANINPFLRYHFLLLPELSKDRIQLIEGKDILATLQLADISADPHLKFMHNSMAGGASVNNLHIHGVYYPQLQLPIEHAKDVSFIVREGLTVSQLEDFPVRSFLFEGENDQIARASGELVMQLQHKNVPYNVLMMRHKVYVLPRGTEDVQIRGEYCNFGALEMAGDIILPSQGLYESISSQEIREALGEATIGEKEFDQLRMLVENNFKSPPSVISSFDVLSGRQDHKYDVDTLQALPFEGISVIHNISDQEAEKLHLRGLALELQQKLFDAGFGHTVAFVDLNSFHATTFDLINEPETLKAFADPLKNSDGLKYQDVRKQIEAKTREFLDHGDGTGYQAPLLKARVKVTGVSITPLGSLRLLIKIVDPEDVQLFEEFRNKLQNFLVNTVKGYATLVREKLPNALAGHITIGYMMNKPEDVGRFIDVLDEINLKFENDGPYSGIEFDLTQGEITEFTDMNHYTTRNESSIDRAMLNVTLQEALTYQKKIRNNFENRDQQAQNLFDPQNKKAPKEIEKAIQKNNGTGESMFQHILLNNNPKIRGIYQEVQRIVREIVGPDASVLEVDLNEIHVTIANDDIAPGEKLTLTLDQLVKDIGEDVRGVRPFKIELVGPHLMPNGVVVMEYTTAAPEFLYLRKKAEDRKSHRRLSENNRASIPKIMHSTVSVIRDPKISQRTLNKLKERLDAYRSSLSPIEATVNKITATHFREKDRRFIESRDIRLSTSDKAQNSQDVGGIDLNQIAIKRTGHVIKVQFDPAQLRTLEQGGFEGFTPVIINITPISSPFQLLGINTAKGPEALAKV